MEGEKEGGGSLAKKMKKTSLEPRSISHRSRGGSTGVSPISLTQLKIDCIALSFRCCW